MQSSLNIWKYFVLRCIIRVVFVAFIGNMCYNIIINKVEIHPI